MAAQYYKINYKSDFVLTINSDAGWAVPFCIKFWTGMPSQAYFVGFDGENYVNCRVGETPTQLLVMFDDHHMPIGELKMQIAYHTTIEDFPDRQFNEVTNPTNVTVDIDGTEYQVMLDFTGESGAEIDFSMPSSGVMSVNGKIGYVTLNAEDVGAQPTIEDLAAIRSGAAAGATAVQPAALQEGLAGKQDTISDLSTIRSGASAGATAVQPAALESGLAEKQDTISDLATIRSGAAAGATAVQPAAMNTALAAKEDKSNKVTSFSSPTDTQYPSAKLVSDQLATKQGTISDLSTIRSGAAAGATAVQPAAFQEGLAGKQDTISDLSTIRSGAAAGATAVQPSGLTPIQTALQTIETVIPSAATAQNQLADKNFVNSSIATNTANFVGTYNSLAELQVVQNPTNNDYGFVIETDAEGNEYYDRYKYVASSQQWLFEYKVESTPFTATQWAAIQSGITSALVTKLNALPTNAELQQTLDGKADAADIPTALSQLSQDSTHRTVTDSEKSTWNGKQNAISDLATIRSGAAAGATAVQPAALQEGLAGKQDTISDLATIRSGAAAGATAVQPAELQEGLAEKQDAIEDLATIRSGAAAGATAVQPAALQEGLAGKQDTISDLATIRSGAAAGATAVQPAAMNTALADKQDTINTVNVTVDNNTGTPSGSASVSGSTLTLSFQNLKGVTGATGATGPQGPQGERGLPGESGVTGDVSGFTVIQTIDPSATYGATDIAGAATVQATNQELTELAGELYKTTFDIVVTDMTSEYNYANAQKYGTVGNTIQTFNSDLYKSTKILKTDGVTKVSLFVSSRNSPSSLIQYVDDNDIIIELGGTDYSKGQSNVYGIVWPTGATAAYISMVLSDAPTSDVIYIETKTNIVTTPIIGDTDNLLTEDKSNLVAAINELQPKVSEMEDDLFYYSESGGSDVNISSDYTFSNGQKYGNVGGRIQIFTNNNLYKWTKILKADDVSYVVITPPVTSSSLIQYVDDYDIILKLDATSESSAAGVASRYDIIWPTGATAAYITTATDTQSTSIFKHVDGLITKKSVIGKLEDLSTTNKENLVAAISSIGAGQRLRVLTWNIGHYALGHSRTSAMTSENYEENLVKWKKALTDINADIIGVQEFSEQFYKDESASPQIDITSQNDIFDKYENKFIGQIHGYIGNAIFSRLALKNKTSVAYSAADSSRYYQLAEFSFGGQTVAIINTHLDTTNGGDNNRETQIHEIVEATKNYKYCIITADSNIARVIDDQLGSGQYEQFNDYALLHGYDLYSLTNHGFQYGDIMTWPTTGTYPSYSNIPDYPHDFVIVKGFKTSNVVAVDNDLSDHCAFFCDLDIF